MLCPECGAEMKIKINTKRGNKFWGCSKLTACWHTEDYRECYMGGIQIGIGAKVVLRFLPDGEKQEFEFVEQIIEDPLERTGSKYIQGRKLQSPTFGVMPPEGLGETRSERSKLGKDLLWRTEGQVIKYQEEDGTISQVGIVHVY